MTDSDLRSEIISVSRALLEKGMNIATTGNVSARLADNFLITPTGIVPDQLTPESIVPTEYDGMFVGDYAPSSEWALHARIYQNFPDAGAVVHCHSDYCVALACLREPLPAFHYMIAAFGGSDVKCADYAGFGSEDIADTAVVAMQSRSGCLLANHGMVVFGTDLKNALRKAEVLETLAKQYVFSRSVGSPVLITEQIESVQKRYKTYGKQKLKPGATD
jgi:L-fuculose-phosphate aldolase